jgi:hypothetical protein
VVATNIIGALHLCFSDFEKTGRNPAWKESIRQNSSFRPAPHRRSGSANIGRKNPIKSAPEYLTTGETDRMIFKEPPHYIRYPQNGNDREHHVCECANGNRGVEKIGRQVQKT